MDGLGCCAGEGAQSARQMDMLNIATSFVHLSQPPLPPQVLEPKDGKVIYKDWDAMGSDISKLENFDDDEQPLPQNVSGFHLP
jgi:hypothetical protein